MYNHYAATVEGLAGQILKSFFQNEVNDEIGHAQFLAEKIVALAEPHHAAQTRQRGSQC